MYLSNRPHFKWVYRRDKTILVRYVLSYLSGTLYLDPSVSLHEKSLCVITREKLVNQSPSARDLQAFLVFSQHPKWVITPVNPLKVWSLVFIKYNCTISMSSNHSARTILVIL